MENFYKSSDDFAKIIKNNIGEFESMHQISTGWTNFVFDVKKNNNEYIFRFPRNNFFASVLEKEVTFSKYLKGKINTPTSDINLFFDNNRPYTMHKKIKGTSLTQKYKDLTYNDRERIAKQIAEFIYELQNVTLKDFSLKLQTASQFLEELSHVDDEYYDLKKHAPLISREESSQVLNHADLNPGNILIDDNNNVCCILDFAFVSMSSNINDISRLIGRMPYEFHETLLSAYNTKFNTNISMTEIDELISVWNYVEEHYINYMKKNQPDIDIGR